MATNLAAGDHATVAALLPAAPILIAHLGGSEGQAVAVQSAWALGTHMLSAHTLYEVTPDRPCSNNSVVAAPRSCCLAVTKMRASGAILSMAVKAVFGY